MTLQVMEFFENPDNQRFTQNNLRCLRFQIYEVLGLLRTVFCKKCKVCHPNMNACEKFKFVMNKYITACNMCCFEASEFPL